MLVEKIIKSVESTVGVKCLYHADGKINELLTWNTLPASYVFLLTDTTEVLLSGQIVEQAQVAVFFVDSTAFDFGSAENEAIILAQRRRALRWLRSLMQSETLRVVSVGNAERVYDEFDDVVTGYALRLTLCELQGVSDCSGEEIDTRHELTVTENGWYNVSNVNTLHVATPALAAVSADVLTVDRAFVADALCLYDTPSVADEPHLGVFHVEHNGNYTIGNDIYWAKVEVIETYNVTNETLSIQ